MLSPSGILITGHEGDLLHMIDAGIRMSEGELPHLDFMTPIGIFGFAPIALFLKLGSPAGEAAVLANLLVCALLLPATWWVGASRLTPKLAWLFGAMVIVISTALVHGNGSISIGFSMYYNRWSWAITLIILVTLLFPPRAISGTKWVDPLIVGIGMAMLALTKITFFVPLVPAIIFILLSGKRYRFALISVASGMLIAAVMALLLGVEFFVAYGRDLLAVAAGGAGREYPGLDIGGVLSDPSKIAATTALIGAIIYFRKAGRLRQGLVMLILAPAFIYITFQNWGNDPKWLYFLILYLIANLPHKDQGNFMGMPARQAGTILVTIAVTAAIPSATSLVASTPRAAFASLENAEKIPLAPGLADLWMTKSRILVTGRSTTFVDETPPGDDDQILINGAALSNCKLEGGFIALTNAISRELDAMPELKGKQVLTADILNVGWLMGDLPRVTGAAIWYYDDNSGFDAADYFVVPTCPLRPKSRNVMVENMLETGWTLDMRYASRLMTLYRIMR